MKCCNIITDLITGVIPGVVDDGPPVVLNLYFAANVPIEGEFGDILDAGAFGSTSIPLIGGGTTLATFLQSNVSEFAGGGILDGDAAYSFWFLAESNPADWTWNGNPLVFTDLGVAAIGCYDTGVFAVNDVSQDAPFGFNNTDMGTFTVQGIILYNDPGLQAQMDTQIVQFAGVGTGIVVTVDSNNNTIRVVVSNTYLPLNVMFSLIGGVTPQSDPFNPC